MSEAAERFALPQSWIRAVIDVESHGDPRAVSPKGAIGLMQLRPKTYNALRLRYALGADAFNPHDNIMAGAAYLRELYDRHGAAGFLAAYNAGPKRYRKHLTSGRPLPLETRAYVAQLHLRLSGELPQNALTDTAPDTDWQSSTLFLAHLKSGREDSAGTSVSASARPSNDTPTARQSSFIPQAVGLFTVASAKKGAP